jgi:hypothetical protein
MIGDTIAFSLRNLPAILFIAALVVTAAGLGRGPASQRMLAWLLLLPIGVTGLWAGISHVFFPEMAAAHIGWQPSPFQFEVGMADLAIGVTACLAFWGSWEFRAAAVCAASIFLLGDAVGHVHQMWTAANFAPGNAGVPFYMDLICPLLAIVLVIATRDHLSARH